jgi:hypothetical protein
MLALLGSPLRYAAAKRVAAITSPTLLAYSTLKSAIVEELLSGAETELT